MKTKRKTYRKSRGRNTHKIKKRTIKRSKRKSIKTRRKTKRNHKYNKKGGWPGSRFAWLAVPGFYGTILDLPEKIRQLDKILDEKEKDKLRIEFLKDVTDLGENITGIKDIDKDTLLKFIKFLTDYKEAVLRTQTTKSGSNTHDDFKSVHARNMKAASARATLRKQKWARAFLIGKDRDRKKTETLRLQKAYDTAWEADEAAEAAEQSTAPRRSINNLNTSRRMRRRPRGGGLPANTLAK